MNIKEILPEIKSPALRELMRSLTGTIEKMEEKKLSTAEASNEVAAHKHAMSLIALDWLYNRKISNLKKLTRMEAIQDAS